MANEIIGYGATLAYSDTVSGTYTVIAGLTDLEPSGVQLDKVKTTAHDSPSYTHTYQPGMIEPGEFSFKAHFKKATTGTALYNLLVNRNVKFWRLTFALALGESTPSMFKCQGFVGEYKLMTPLTDNLIADCKIICSGPVTFTEGS